MKIGIEPCLVQLLYAPSGEQIAETLISISELYSALQLAWDMLRKAQGTPKWRLELKELLHNGKV